MMEEEFNLSKKRKELKNLVKKREFRERFADAIIKFDKGYGNIDELRSLLREYDRFLIRDEELAGEEHI